MRVIVKVGLLERGWTHPMQIARQASIPAFPSAADL
jgi:hypothetical protein